MLEESRAELLGVLKDWEAGDRWALVEAAEALEARLLGAGQLPLEATPPDLGGLMKVALDVLSHAHHQCVLPRDRPAIAELLSASPGAEGRAMRDFDAYWCRVDFDGREDDATRYWFGTNAP